MLGLSLDVKGVNNCTERECRAATRDEAESIKLERNVAGRTSVSDD